jgi:hypothetical protein
MQAGHCSGHNKMLTQASHSKFYLSSMISCNKKPGVRIASTTASPMTLMPWPQKPLETSLTCQAHLPWTLVFFQQLSPFDASIYTSYPRLPSQQHTVLNESVIPHTFHVCSTLVRQVHSDLERGSRLHRRHWASTFSTNPIPRFGSFQPGL